MLVKWDNSESGPFQMTPAKMEPALRQMRAAIDMAPEGQSIIKIWQHPKEQ